MKNVLKEFMLTGRVVVITGAAGFLGEMHAEAVAESGGHPVLIDLSQQRLKDVCYRLIERYPECNPFGICCSVTERHVLESVLEQIIDKYGRLDALINNACNNPTMKSDKVFGRLEDLTYDEFKEDTDVGLYGSICCSQVFGSYMSTHGGGVILNIASDLGVIAPNQSLYRVEGKDESEQPKKPITYSTTKWGLIGMTKYLSTYWSMCNVRTNALAFGGVYNNQSDVFVKRVSELIPMHRMARRDEYKGSVVYMISDASSYMNGAVVSVDGGRTAW